ARGCGCRARCRRRPRRPRASRRAAQRGPATRSARRPPARAQTRSHNRASGASGCDVCAPVTSVAGAQRQVNRAVRPRRSSVRPALYLERSARAALARRPEHDQYHSGRGLGGREMASARQLETVEIADEQLANTVVEDTAGLGVRRFFTIPGRDPFDEIEWETRDALIPGKDGPAFEQKNVEFPKFWSQTATNIVAQKYFRGRMSSPERETSVRQMIGRVVDTIAGWGRKGGYFADEEEAQTFEDELKAILVNQYAAFNSPVWFNVGFEEKPQCSACFILSIDDSMEDILDWIRREGIIFRGGSGSGVNLSKLRSSKEQLSKGGYASGPVSFMRGADASAGTIKSGGKTRRAAKMVVLDVDHPDVEEFIWCKAREEQKARVLEQ